jgi:Dolichyl-phosphate-mannose-protein mannosyltransferase
VEGSAGAANPESAERTGAVSRRLRRAIPAAGFVAALGVALGLVFSQPVTSPWWITADADAVYASSGLNLLLGNHTQFFDHPGLPTQEALEAGFGAVYTVEKAVGIRSGGVQPFADHMFLNLDRARPVYRSFAIGFYLLGVVLAFLLVTRLLGHWTWGLAASLLWLAAPALLPNSIQIRPESLLCATVLLATYLVARAAERRDAWLFALAGLAIGFATTEKLTAAGLAPVLLVAAIWRHPGAGWPAAVRARIRAGWNRHRRRALALSLLVLGSIVAFNLDRPAFSLTHEQRTLALTIVALVGGYGAFAVIARRLRLLGADRLFDPFVATLALAVVGGVAIPIVVDPEDGFQMLVAIKDGLLGGGVNHGISPFSQLDRWPYLSYPMLQGVIVFAVAMIAGVVGLLRRAPAPVVFASASAVLALMALARNQQTYYIAPAYVAAIPGALWLFHRSGRRAAPLLLWPLIAVVVVPQLQHRHDVQTAGAEAQAAQLEQLVAPLLKPGVSVMTTISVPDTEFDRARFWGVYTPASYPYHFVSTWPPFINYVVGLGRKVEYYAGPQALQVNGVADVDLAGDGTFHVRRLPQFDGDGIGVLQILSAPDGL